MTHHQTQPSIQLYHRSATIETQQPLIQKGRDWEGEKKKREIEREEGEIKKRDGEEMRGRDQEGENIIVREEWELEERERERSGR